MAKKLEQVELLFENCESVTLNVHDVNVLHLEDVREAVDCWCCYELAATRKTAHEVHLAIPLSKEEYTGYIGNIHVESYSGEQFGGRLLQNDLSNIILHYENNEEDNFRMVWDETSSNENPYQYTYIDLEENVAKVYIVDNYERLYDFKHRLQDPSDSTFDGYDCDYSFYDWDDEPEEEPDDEECEPIEQPETTKSKKELCVNLALQLLKIAAGEE